MVGSSASVVMTGRVAANDNASNGILVWTGSIANVLGNITMEGVLLPGASLQANGNGNNGIDVAVNSSLFVISVDGDYATVQANDNGSDGILLGQGSSAQFGGGASIEATGNGRDGVSVVNGSSAAFVGWGDAYGFTGAFNDNGRFGIVVYSNASLNASVGETASSITATNNGTDGSGYGLVVEAGSSATFDPPGSDAGSKLVLSNNDGYGAGVYSNSTLYLRMPAEIQNNAQDGIGAWGNAFVESGWGGAHTLINGNDGVGISAWNGTGIYLRDDTVADNNGFADVSAGQGSRLDWSSNSRIDSVWCDDTTLAFNDAASDTACPQESAEDSDEESDQ